MKGPTDDAVRVAPGHMVRVDAGRVTVTADDEDSSLAPLLQAHLTMDARDGECQLTLGGRVVARFGARFGVRVPEQLDEQMDARLDARGGSAPTPPDPVTAFEARFLADTHTPLPSPEHAIPLAPRTDLHTHFAAALSGRALVELGCEHGLTLDAARLQQVGVHVDAATRLDALEPRALARLARALDLPIDQQSFFLEMERRYALRAPLTKARTLFVPQLRAIGAALAREGVFYAELSLSEALDAPLLEALHAHLDRIEEETGARLRFLVAFRRDDDTEWDLDVLERLKDCLASRAVVGIDIMGHETSATARVRPVLEAAGRLARERPGLVVRVHAGENPAYPQNVREAVEAMRAFPEAELRIGHGLYGVDDALLDEMARHRERIIVELNLTSNLALNNIQSARHAPITRMIDAGVSVVLGTDGAGLYATRARDEARAALLCGASTANLRAIAETEGALLERKAARERTLPTLSAFRPPAPRGHIHYTDEAVARAAAAREARERALSDALERLDADVVRERPALSGRPLLWIAGAWKNAIAEWSEAKHARVDALLGALMPALAARGAVLLTGGTRHGVEGLVHAHATGARIDVIGAVPDDVPPDDLDARVRTFWRCAPSMWAKADPVVRLVRDVDGFALFVGGGLIVADEEQAAANLGVRHAVVRGLPGAAARALEASARTPFVDDASEVLAAFDARAPRGQLRHEGANDAVDLVVTRAAPDGRRELLVIVRHDRSGAAAGVCALPGGFVRAGETHEAAAARVLARESGVLVDARALAAVCVVDGPGRDPRDTPTRWVRTTLFVADVAHASPVVAGAGAARARFVALDERPALAFDHDRLVLRALEWAAAHADPRDRRA